MKPSIEIDLEQKLIITHLKDNMSKTEIYEFVDELHHSLEKLKKDHSCVSLLNNASEKSFQDLDSARELSEAFSRLLSENHVAKFATLRPQADYYSENSIDYPEQFRIFQDEMNARNWLEN